MNVQILSDIHLEFLGGGKAYIDRLDQRGVDVLILAGDIATKEYLVQALRRLCSKFAHVVYVYGNHEFYQANPEAVKREVTALAKETPNLHVLDNTVWEHQGVKFAGTSLWFPYQAGNSSFYSKFADFVFVRPAKKSSWEWIYEEHRKAKLFLETHATEANVIVTHHIPSEQAVALRWKGSDFNRFFVGDVTDVLFGIQKPVLWVFGHTHDPGRFQVGQVSCVTNPLGYPDEKRGPGFVNKLVYEVTPAGHRPVETR